MLFALQGLCKVRWGGSGPSKNSSRRHHNPELQAVLQSYNEQNSMVLVQELTLRSMEQNREPRNGATDVWPTNFLQSR